MSGLPLLPLLPVPTLIRFLEITDERMRRIRAPDKDSGSRNPLRQPPFKLIKVPPAVFNSAYDLATWNVADPANPAKDLIQQLMMYRATYGYWNGRNVAVIEFETKSGNPPKVMMVAASGGMLHSEQRLMAMLSLAGLGDDVKQVTRMFTDLEPCDGKMPCPGCRSMLADLAKDPKTAHLVPKEIFYTHEYDTAPTHEHPEGTRDVGTKALEKANKEVAANPALCQGLRDNARADINKGNVVVDGRSNHDTSKAGDQTTVKQRELADIPP